MASAVSPLRVCGQRRRLYGPCRVPDRALARRVQNSPGVHLRTPSETFDEHLTKGEITRDEYVERHKALDFKAVIVRT